METESNRVEVETYNMTEVVFSIVDVVKEYTMNQNNQFRVSPRYKDVNMFMSIIIGKNHPSAISK